MNVELMKALEQIEEEKGIGKEVIIEAIEAALLSAYKKNYGASAQNMRIEVDRETGEMRAYQIRTIVETVEDEHTQISLTEAQQWDPSAKIGDMVEVEVTPRDFGRIAAQTAKQVVVERLREAERDLVYKEFRDREGDIVTGTVQRIERKNVYLDLGRIEAVLPPTEQIPRESYRQSERIKAYVVEVRQGTRGPQIVVSRTHPGLLKRLFELEVPEIYEGIVEIKAIAREAGGRPKVAAGSPPVEGRAAAEASGEATSVPEEPAATEAPNAAPAQALDVPTSSGAEGAAADGEAGEPVAASEAPADPDHATKKTAEADA